ncbi:hypothetical protein HPB47_013047 [Ixodes persulcatus]|uniref:Uncharacterized protein n=1 Tax=Ixodes persulcatus TaxID=34615 RepID=A0AC60NRW1_IXOPE|nr:hypothetical protein HPB47_013047 [Ixodes persulcatus]
MTPPDGFKKTSWSDASGSPKSTSATGRQTVPGWRSKAPTTGGDQLLNQRLRRLDSVTESPSLGSVNSSSCSSLGSLWEPDYGRRLERYRSFGSVPRIAPASGQAGQLSTSRSCGALARAHRTRKPHLDSSSEIDWRMSEISLLPDDNFLESDISLVRLEPDSLNISLCSNPQEQPRSSSVASVRSTPPLPAPDSVVTDERLRSKDIGEGIDHHHSASNHGLQRSPKRRQIGYSKDSLEALAVHVPRDPDTPRTLSLDSVTLDECLVLLRHDEAQESLERPGGHSVRRCCSESSAKQGMARCLRPSLSDDDDPTLSSGSPLSLSSRTTCTQTDSGHEMVVYSRSCPPEPSPQSLLWELLDLMKILARGPAFQQEHRCRCCCNHNGRQSAVVQSKCSVEVCKRPVNEFDCRGTSPKGNKTASLSDHASIQRSEARKNCVLSSDRTSLVRLTEKTRSAKRVADESLDSGILMDSSSVSGSSSPERWLSSNAEIPSKTSIVRENSGDSGIASDSSRSPSAVTKRPGTLPRQGSKPGAHDWTSRTPPRPDQRVPLPHRPVHQSGTPRVRGSGDLFPADSFRTLPLISLYGTSWGSRVPQGYVYGLPASTTWNYGTTMAQCRRPS